MRISKHKAPKQVKLTPEQYQDELRKSAQKVKENAERYLPALLNTQEALKNAPNIYLLPQTIHTIAIALPQQCYKFLAELNALYSQIINDGKPAQLNHDTWKSVKTTAGVVNKMYKQETEEDAKQVEFVKCRYNELVKKEGAENVRPLDIDKEREFFRHVECDLSSAVKSFIFLQTTGLFLDSKYNEHLANMLPIATELIDTAITRQQTAIENANKILS